MSRGNDKILFVSGIYSRQIKDLSMHEKAIEALSPIHANKMNCNYSYIISLICQKLCEKTIRLQNRFIDSLQNRLPKFIRLV